MILSPRPNCARAMLKDNLVCWSNEKLVSPVIHPHFPEGDRIRQTSLNSKSINMLKLVLLACIVVAANAQSCGNTPIPPSEVSANIVGGTVAVPGSWPWMTEVIKDWGGLMHYCGGTLINDQWVVSAAHCFEKRPNLGKYQFSVGGHMEMDFSETTRQTKTASMIIRHEAYSSSTSSNDIALIKLSEPVTFDNYVQPACMVTTRPPAGTLAWVTGWGAQETAQHDENLHQVDVPIISQQTCRDGYPQYTIDDSMICAGYAMGGKDSCQGDSGGPMVVKDDASGIWSLVGVVSWGVGCADPGDYGVYSNVANLHQWIQDTMAANP